MHARYTQVVKFGRVHLHFAMRHHKRGEWEKAHQAESVVVGEEANKLYKQTRKISQFNWIYE